MAMKITHTEDYAKMRREAYPPIGDQLDEIWRLLATVQALNLASNPVYAQITAVKSRFPKPAAQAGGQ